MSDTTPASVPPAGDDSPTNKVFPLAPLEGETPAAYEAFLCYLELPNAKRSIKAAAEALGGSANTFEEWCTRFQWRARMRAYFAQLAGKRIQPAAAPVNAENAVDKAQIQELAEQKEARLRNRLLDSSAGLLEHRLEHHPDDFTVKDILHMVVVGGQLNRSRRNTRSNGSNGSSNSTLRKELQAVAQLARERRLSESQTTKAEPANPPPPQQPENPPKPPNPS